MTNHGTFVRDEEHDHDIEIPAPYVLGSADDSFVPLANHMTTHARDIAPTRGWVRVNDRVFWYSNCGLGGFHVEEVDPVEWQERPSVDEARNCPGLPSLEVHYERNADGVWSVFLRRPYPHANLDFLVDTFGSVNGKANALLHAHSLGVLLGAKVVEHRA